MLRKKARHKFNAKPTTVDAIRFASKLEASYYKKLQALKLSGVVLGFFMQVPLHFKSGIIYRMDFLVFYEDGKCEAIDVKGMETPTFKLKLKLIEEEYPWIELRIIRS